MVWEQTNPDGSVWGMIHFFVRRNNMQIYVGSADWVRRGKKIHLPAVCIGQIGGFESTEFSGQDALLLMKHFPNCFLLFPEASDRLQSTRAVA